MELVAPLAGAGPVPDVLRQRSGLYHVGWRVDAIEASLGHPSMKNALPLTTALPAMAFGSRLVQFFVQRDGGIIELINN